MIRALSILSIVASVVGAFVLCGLVTNWFRYQSSLEGIFVIAVCLIAVAVVSGLSYVSFARNNVHMFGVSAIAMAISIVIVLIVYSRTFGGLPRFYLNHVETSRPAVLQTIKGPLEYWIELRNPFSRNHSEFLIVRRGKKERIPIRIFGDSGGPYITSSSNPGDWGTLATTSDPNIVILTLGEFLGRPGQQFRVDLAHRTAVAISNNH